MFQTTNEKGSQCFVRCQGCTKFSHANNTDSIVCQQMKEMKHSEHRLDEKTGQTFQKQLLKRSVFRQHRTQIVSTLISNSVTYLQEKHDFNTKPLVPEDQVFTIKVKNTKETIVHQSTANAQHTVIM